MGIVDIAEKIVPKVNWPATVVIVAGMALYAFVLAPEHATIDDVKKHVKESEERVKAIIDKHHPAVDIKTEVHSAAIDTLKRCNDERIEDIRELRRDR